MLPRVGTLSKGSSREVRGLGLAKWPGPWLGVCGPLEGVSVSLECPRGALGHTWYCALWGQLRAAGSCMKDHLSESSKYGLRVYLAHELDAEA